MDRIELYFITLINLSKVDIVIISHGHLDHGEALDINTLAKIYVQRKAFDPHYNKVLFLKFNVGINKNYKTHPQVVLIDGDYVIDDELVLFTVNDTSKCRSTANDVLYDSNGKDNFSHEQNLIIRESKSTLIMGCGHAGVVNILK